MKVPAAALMTSSKNFRFNPTVHIGLKKPAVLYFIPPNRQMNIKFCVGASGTAVDPAEGAVGPVLQDGGRHEEPQLGHVREGPGQQGPGRLYCVVQH